METIDCTFEHDASVLCFKEFSWQSVNVELGTIKIDIDLDRANAIHFRYGPYDMANTRSNNMPWQPLDVIWLLSDHLESINLQTRLRRN